MSEAFTVETHFKNGNIVEFILDPFKGDMNLKSGNVYFHIRYVKFKDHIQPYTFESEQIEQMIFIPHDRSFQTISCIYGIFINHEYLGPIDRPYSITDSETLHLSRLNFRFYDIERIDPKQLYSHPWHRRIAEREVLLHG